MAQLPNDDYIINTVDARLLDNVDTKFLENYAAMSDLQFADAMADQWDSWITAALAAGVLTA